MIVYKKERMRKTSGRGGEEERRRKEQMRTGKESKSTVVNGGDIRQGRKERTVDSTQR